MPGTSLGPQGRNARSRVLKTSPLGPYGGLKELTCGEIVEFLPLRSFYRSINDVLADLRFSFDVAADYIRTYDKRFRGHFKDVDLAVIALLMFHKCKNNYDDRFEGLLEFLPMFNDGEMIVEMQQKLEELVQQKRFTKEESEIAKWYNELIAFFALTKRARCD